MRAEPIGVVARVGPLANSPSVIIRMAKGGRVAVPGWMREMYGLKPGRRVLGIANRGSAMLTAGVGWLLLRGVGRKAEVRGRKAGA